MTGFYMKFITSLEWVDLVLLFITWKMQFELNILALFVSYVQYHYYSGSSLPSSDTLNDLQFELALCARFFWVTSKTCKCYFQDTNKLRFQEMEENLKNDLRSSVLSITIGSTTVLNQDGHNIKISSYCREAWLFYFQIRRVSRSPCI